MHTRNTQTLGVVLKALFQKQLAKQGYNLIEYLFGFEPEETVKVA